MFTGIIEALGLVKEITTQGGNLSFWVESPLAPELKVDQSLSHNGVCLTVEAINGNLHRVTAIAETLSKTNLGDWKTGTLINLERCLQLNGRLDGHLVQGHVDTTGTCIAKEEKNGSWEFEFSFPPSFGELVIEKGSICIDGISLTAFDVKENSLRVAIVPYTFEHTTMKQLRHGDKINFEFDVIGKYVLRRLSLKGNN
jgi:riboflavin synthase